MRYFVMKKKGGKMNKGNLETLPQIGITVGLPPQIVKSIDIMRGDIPRSAYLRKKIIAAVEAELVQLNKAV